MAHVREKRNACRVSESKSEFWIAVEKLCVRRYRFSGVYKTFAYLAARRAPWVKKALRHTEY